MPKLHQVIALEKTRKNHAKTRGDELYHALQRHQLANGSHGVYEPKTDRDNQLPEERQLVQVDVTKLLDAYAKSQTAAWDITVTRDMANTVAKADVTVEGETLPLLTGMPVSSLIFLEKQLADLKTVISHAPVLDPAEDWHFDEGSGLHRTEPVRSVRTKKVTSDVVVIPPTEQHPGQWKEKSEDVPAGTWVRHRVSGAIPATRKEELLTRVTKLLEAVKTAREEANTTEAPEVRVGETVFSWLLS